MDKLVTEEFKIPRTHINIASKHRVVCLVEQKWLEELATLNKFPERLPVQKALSHSEGNLLLAASQTNIPHPWIKLSIKIIQKENLLVKRFPSKRPAVRNDGGFFETEAAISQDIFETQWIKTNQKYGASLELPTNALQETEDFNKAVRRILQKLFLCPFISTNLENKDLVSGDGNCYPGICPAYCIIETPTSFYVLQSYSQHSLRDLIYFSPAIFTGCYAKPLFVLYQILQAINYCHNYAITVGNIRLQDVLLDKNYWVQIAVPRTESLYQGVQTVERTGSEAKVPILPNIDLNTVTLENLKEVTQNWVHHKISNFQYLMMLNYLAGRQMNDPNHHPVLPWVMDFTQPDGGYRDFSKSKFRLNKGDAQLDLMFESLPPLLGTQLHTQEIHVKHHISDMLSEITYYVYKARQTPKEILCTHVRSKWEPNEYPSSMQRMQEWTPDECIPEFYTDPSIFTSIHKDLPDLEIPAWSKSAEDFTQQHLSVLEGPYVSEHLHKWIDLTFGYKLCGKAAVKYKNVCLQLVNGHINLSNHGVVQLFEECHPQRICANQYYSSVPPTITKISYSTVDHGAIQGKDHKKVQGLNAALLVFGETLPVEVDFEKKGVDTLSEKRQRNDTILDNRLLQYKGPINLPVDYDPLEALRKIEVFQNFCQQTKNIDADLHVCKKEAVQKTSDLKPIGTIDDMKAFGCLIAEMFLSLKFRALGPDASLEERFQEARTVCKTFITEVPSPVRHVLKILLLLNEKHETTDYPTVNEQGLPTPSPGLLLNPVADIMPFPPYFQEIYTFLSKLKELDADFDSEENSYGYIKDKVQLMANCIDSLVECKKEEAILLIIPYVEDLFKDGQCCLHAMWSLFTPISIALGPKETAKRFLPNLLDFYNMECHSLKHMKFYHRSFLLQLVMRLGLQTFLTHFSTLLIEAVSGYRDYSPGDGVVTQISADTDFVPEQSNVDMESEISFIDDSCNVESETEDNDQGCSITRGKTVSESDSIGVSEKLDTKSVNSYDSDSESELLKSIGQASIRSRLLRREVSESNANPEHFRPRIGSDKLVRERSGSAESKTSGTSKDSVEQKSSESQSGESNNDTRSRHGSGGSVKSSKSIGCTSSTTRLSGTEDSMVSVLHRNGEANVCDVASESVRWLAHRLGPFLSAKYLTGNLLRMLVLCYLGDEQIHTVTVDDVLCASKKGIAGDWNASKVLTCLSDIAILYGEQLILLQYFPHIANLIGSAQQRINPHVEAGIISCAALIHHILPYLSDTVLMDYLQETIFKEMLQPLIRIITSQTLHFPSGSRVRAVIGYKIIDILYLIGLRIGFENARTHMTEILCLFFASFDAVYKGTNIAPDLPASPVIISSVSPKKSDLSRCSSEDMFLDIKMDSSTQEYKIGTPVRADSFKHLNESGSWKHKTHSLSPSVQEEDVNVPVGNKEQIKEELRLAFSPHMAHTAYIAFCKVCGGIHLDNSLKNSEMIRRLIDLHEETIAQQNAAAATAGMVVNNDSSDSDSDSDEGEDYVPSQTGQTSWFIPVPKIKPDDSAESEVTGSFGRNVMKIGNRISLSEDASAGLQRKKTEQATIDPSRLKSLDMDSYKQRHLRGNWLAYWEHELGMSERETSFNFKQIKLQHFTGHTSTVRAIHVMDNENSFISASKDKTVKLWSLRSFGDGMGRCPAQWTYTHHKKSVFSVTFLESLRLAASCDSTVHLWDPFAGECIRQFDSVKNSPVSVVMPLPPPSSTLVAATTDATLKFLDVRAKEYTHQFRCTTSQAGVIRCLSVSPDGLWIAIGYSSGIISVLDVRTGLVMGVWKGHENEILQLRAYDNYSFVTSSFDQQMTLWSVEKHVPLCHFKGQADPVHCFNFYRNEIVSVTTGNRVGVHTEVSSQASFSSTKLRSDTFKGVLTTMAVLPLNRMLLLGADNGGIKLLC